MNRVQLEKKYGRNLINNIFSEGYLDGCTIAIINGEDVIPEIDIQNAIYEIRNSGFIANWD